MQCRMVRLLVEHRPAVTTRPQMLADRRCVARVQLASMQTIQRPEGNAVAQTSTPAKTPTRALPRAYDASITSNQEKCSAISSTSCSNRRKIRDLAM